MSFLLALCAVAGSEAFANNGSSLRPEDYRVGAVTYRLATRGSGFCSAAHPLSGLMLHHLADYSKANQAEADRSFGLGRGPGVLAVIEGGPAAEAGIRAGDVLLSVNGRRFLSPQVAAAERDGKKRRRLVEAGETVLEEQLRLGPAAITLWRAGESIEARLRPRAGCPARGRLARSRQANAFADGRYAIMTTKMLEFMQSDDELAVAMAHELAHNILGHPGELEAKGVPYGFFRGLGKNAARVLRTEQEADRLGVKLLWAAGYDVSAAVPFWRRLHAKYDPLPAPKAFRTHPSLAARERLINETIAELRASGSQPGPKRP
jgi:hypothetical protein